MAKENGVLGGDVEVVSGKATTNLPGFRGTAGTTGWTRSTLVLGVALCGLALGCGGSAESTGDDGSGGSSTASSSSSTNATTSSSSTGAGGSTGSSSGMTEATVSSATASTTDGRTTSGTSTSTTGTTGEACCLAAAACNSGDIEISGPDACPDGVSCYSNEICCSQVWCMPDLGNCNGRPSCEDGDAEVALCPDGGECYTRELCGDAVLCLEADCHPDEEPNRSYVATGPTCQLVDFVCTGESDYFYDECGCGCEQDADCPEWFDCLPGDELDPACSNPDICPFSGRAQ